MPVMFQVDSCSQHQLSQGWDEIADRAILYPEFYQFVIDACHIVNLPKTARVADIGCGAGKLLELLSAKGYQHLLAVDFSRKTVARARDHVPEADGIVPSIVETPLPRPVNALFFTEVIEHVTSPHRALEHLYHSLESGGYLFLTFPNRSAYIPWLYLRWLAPFVTWWPWLHHWVSWFTMPYEMRTTQPLDHSYSGSELAEFIEAAGFQIVQRRGMRFLPMLRIPNMPIINGIVVQLERLAQHTPVQWWYYRSMFICQRR